jgi:transposase
MQSVLQVLFCFLGIDVSKSMLEVFLTYSDSRRDRSARFPNTKEGCLALLCWLGEDATGCRAIMEATSRYHRLCEHALVERCAVVELLNPRRARALSIGLGLSDKDDKVDAKVLSQAARLLKERDLCVPSLAAQDLRDLSRAIDQMKCDAADYLKRLEGLEKDSPAYEAHLQACEALKAAAKAQEKLWAELVAQDPETWRRYQLARSVPSVGHATARAVAVELPSNLGKVNMRKIAGYAGLAPRRHESGDKSLQPAIYGGNARLRTALFMASMHSVYHGDHLNMPFYERLKNRKDVSLRTPGGRHLKAITAVMRKLLCTIVAVINRNQPWQEIPPQSPHVQACKQAVT